jgi:triacylglycerol lipase
MADSRHLVDPELLQLLELAPTRPLNVDTLAEARAEAVALLAQQLKQEPNFPDVDTSERFVPGRDGAPDVRVLVYMPTEAPRPLPAMLWIHGGGYVAGIAEGDGLVLKTLVRDLGCAVVSVDYRLAPESPFPAAVEDCYAALAWLHAEASSLDIDTDRIAVGGASAGCGLAASLALLARDRGELRIAFQLLQVPMLDDRTATLADPHPYTGQFTWTNDRNVFGWTSLLGQAPGSANVSPYAAAARAESLAGLPPAWIGVGALDLFVEEDIDYARRLIRAGVPTELHVYPGAYHGFSRATNARVTQAYRRDIANALLRAFEKAPTRHPVAAD